MTTHTMDTMDRTAAWSVCDTPLGPLTLIGGQDGLRAVHFPGLAPELPGPSRRPERLAEAMGQIKEYLDGERRAFDLDLDLRGTPLELRVWRELQRLPYGTTVTYSGLAAAVGRPDAVRSVAGAVARTPVPIVIPCHRVVGADGSLRGYVGGLERKAALLALEGGPAARPLTPGGWRSPGRPRSA